MADNDDDKAEKIGYLTRAVEDLSVFVRAHMATEEARFAPIESRMESMNKKMNIMFLLMAALAGAFVAQEMGIKQLVLKLIELL